MKVSRRRRHTVWRLKVSRRRRHTVWRLGVSPTQVAIRYGDLGAAINPRAAEPSPFQRAKSAESKGKEERRGEEKERKKEEEEEKEKRRGRKGESFLFRVNE